jgi:hypothetical protein
VKAGQTGVVRLARRIPCAAAIATNAEGGSHSFWMIRILIRQVKDTISKDIQEITGHSVKDEIDQMARIQVGIRPAIINSCLPCSMNRPLLYTLTIPSCIDDASINRL